MDPQRIAELKGFVRLLRKNPAVMFLPELDFFRRFIEEDCKGHVSPPPSPAAAEPDEPMADVHQTKVEEEHVDENVKVQEPKRKEEPEEEHKQEVVVEEEKEEEDDYQDPDIVPPETDPPQDMGDPNIEVSEDAQSLSMEKRSDGVRALREGRLYESLDILTEAVRANATSAPIFAARAEAFVLVKKPMSAIRDAERAIELNVDSPRGHRSRGHAHFLLGHWKEALKDFYNAQQCDYDEDTKIWITKTKDKIEAAEARKRK
eukprot:TRINITY_DN11350_c0_g1_i1.p2 TRINITY_DN11350_c0_g1~~TRINITY_DN11350_c0_g1_i1.p2  ORF type:complete len:261 (+),score=85.31 TRINITY_DN11350_c0_g1_i1:30-812(+)